MSRCIVRANRYGSLELLLGGLPIPMTFHQNRGVRVVRLSDFVIQLRRLASRPIRPGDRILARQRTVRNSIHQRHNNRPGRPRRGISWILVLSGRKLSIAFLMFIIAVAIAPVLSACAIELHRFGAAILSAATATINAFVIFISRQLKFNCRIERNLLFQKLRAFQDLRIVCLQRSNSVHALNRIVSV